MLALIGWIGRILLILLVVRLVLRLFMPAFTRTGSAPGGPRRGPFGGRQPQPERLGGQLVPCAQCHTYVPASTAIHRSHGAGNLSFCSEKCRDAYAAVHS